jgi:hypothetical protein
MMFAFAGGDNTRGSWLVSSLVYCISYVVVWMPLKEGRSAQSVKCKVQNQSAKAKTVKSLCCEMIFAFNCASYYNNRLSVSVTED